MPRSCNASEGCGTATSSLCYACGLPTCTEHNQLIEPHSALRQRYYDKRRLRICDDCWAEYEDKEAQP